jgi:hypothetical protein
MAQNRIIEVIKLILNMYYKMTLDLLGDDLRIKLVLHLP